MRQVRIISLKWKALWGLSLVLFCNIAALSWLSYSNLWDQFEAARAAEEAVYVREIQVLLRQINVRLQQLSSGLPGLREALQAEDPGAIRQVFERHWPGVRLDYDLQSASLYSPQGRLLGQWGDDPVPPAVPADWPMQVMQHKRPLYALICTERCSQVGALPLQVDRRTIGVLVLTTSVTELVRRFREVTGRDIGVLIRPAGPGGAADEDAPLLVPWDLKVVALSDARHRLPLLRRAARQGPDLPQGQGLLQIEDGQRAFTLKLFPMREITPFGSGFFLVLSDITGQLQRIRAGAWYSLLAGVGGGTLSELVLLLILSPPLTRLQRTARVLPLLAQNGFAAVHGALTRDRRRGRLQDEIDDLDRTAIDLASQLEVLNHRVLDRSEALKLRMHELDRERGFVTSLLDTAQVVILTQDREGRVRLANRHALKLTGLGLMDLVGRPFRDLLNPLDAQSSAAVRGRLLRREIAHCSHEAELICTSGRRLQLAWFHSTLTAAREGDAQVLSAGLDITERKHAEQRIAWLADHDPLTGLVNRRRFEELLQAALRREQGGDTAQGALMYIDLDQFKLINDTAGHSVGDQVLASFAGHLARLSESIAPGRHGIAARLGGDEFGLIIEDLDRDATLAAAERLREGLLRLEIRYGPEVFRVTSSIGVALYPEHGLGLQSLMQNADLAMYQARGLGEGRVQLFSGDAALRRHMVQRLRWKERIDEALGNDRLVLYFQPIMALADGRITHYEALVRMPGPDGELLPPADFIPVAEATGQISRLDCQVLEQVFASWRRLNEAHQAVGVHVNLSARTFQTPEWWTLLDRLLACNDLDPGGLVFEISETAAGSDLKDARVLMEAVRSKGCRFALDDFGMGFASFNYVKELPVDLVKIDGAFITRLAERYDSQLVVKALVDVARGFGKQTVAQFVDSAETLALLRDLGVDYAEGFHVGKPVPEQVLLPEAGGAGGRSPSPDAA